MRIGGFIGPMRNIVSELISPDGGPESDYIRDMELDDPEWVFWLFERWTVLKKRIGTFQRVNARLSKLAD
jgi:hypothetical protein